MYIISKFTFFKLHIAKYNEIVSTFADSYLVFAIQCIMFTYLVTQNIFVMTVDNSNYFPMETLSKFHFFRVFLGVANLAFDTSNASTLLS